MAFSNTVESVEKYGRDLVIERGTWDSAGVTTGTITADTTGSNKLKEILVSDFASDGDNAVSKNFALGASSVTVTTTLNDTGTYSLIGKPA